MKSVDTVGEDVVNFARKSPNSFPERDLPTHSLQRGHVFRHKGPDAPHYAHKSRRLESFQNWPRSLRQTPQELAEAGFFYQGTGDQVHCFYCGGGLMSWDPVDEPWREHAKWHGHCEFMLMVKGKAFVHQVLREGENKPTTQSADMAANSRASPEAEDLKLGGSNQENQKNSPRLPLSKKTLICHNSPEELFSENEKLKEDRLCRICFDNDKQLVFMPCGHLFACGSCGLNLTNCPVCRTKIEASMRIYMS